MFKISDLIKINEAVFEIPKTYRSDMRVPARVILTQDMLQDILEDDSLIQIANVATLPGIVNYAIAMPDIHQGYGFPIGGVAAFDIENNGIISPGGIGYDINCGVRLLGTSSAPGEIRYYLDNLATEIFNNVPSGVGRGGKIKLTEYALEQVLINGANYMVSQGHGEPNDIELCEENGNMKEADPALVSTRAKNRGIDQLGTLGAGNHFLEIQQVQEIYDHEIAKTFGITQDMVTVMIHCGSRGLGHQTCTDYVRDMLPKISNWGITLVDKELACAPFKSEEAQNYYKAMCASANFAWANRQVIANEVRKAFKKIVGKHIEVNQIYDLSHNMGKKESHFIDGQYKDLIVHRKGATRSFGPNRLEVAEKYRAVGHPVLIPGTMGTSSYVLVGTEAGMQISFGSSCHGAGRKLSRMKAKKTIRGTELRKYLESQGIVIRCESDVGLAEEAPAAYKDVDNVVKAIELAGIAKRVAKLTPMAVVKGG